MNNRSPLIGTIFLVATFAAFGFTPASAQDARPNTVVVPRSEIGHVTPPRQELPLTIRFCGIVLCGTLTLNGDHYDAVYDNGAASTYTIERFTAGEVVIKRVDPNGETAILKGKMSPAGNSVLDGNMTWTSGGGGGPYPFKLAWGSALNTLPGSADSPNLSASRISMPPGASPQYASFPADVRAVLRQESAVLPSRLKLPCADAANESMAKEALEIGKYAWRAADFHRGYCWIKRSADLGNVRAKVLLGLSAALGWGVPLDRNAAFQYFKAQADTTSDVWAAYFTGQCYEAGAGTPIDKRMVVHFNTWLMLRPEGQALFLSIGDDDAEVHRQYETGLAFFSPPIAKRRVCQVVPRSGEVCHIEESIDDERLQQQLDAVNRKYGK